MGNPKRNRWTLVFYDMASERFTPRTRLHRELKRLGVAMHSQSVYCIPYTANSFQQLRQLDEDVCMVKADVPSEKIKELVTAYDAFAEKLFTEVVEKIDELEDAKVLATGNEPSRKRGYSKRLNKMHERIDHLMRVAKLRDSSRLLKRVKALKTRVALIEHAPPGTLIDWENALVQELDN